MGKTANLGLEIGAFAGDGGNEGAFDRNMKKIDAAIGGAPTQSPVVDATYAAGKLTLTKADATTIELTIPAA